MVYTVITYSLKNCKYLRDLCGSKKTPPIQRIDGGALDAIAQDSYKYLRRAGISRNPAVAKAHTVKMTTSHRTITIRGCIYPDSAV